MVSRKAAVLLVLTITLILSGCSVKFIAHHCFACQVIKYII